MMKNLTIDLGTLEMWSETCDRSPFTDAWQEVRQLLKHGTPKDRIHVRWNSRETITVDVRSTPPPVRPRRLAAK